MLTHNWRWAQNLYRTFSPGSDSGQDRPFLQELAQALPLAARQQLAN